MALTASLPSLFEINLTLVSLCRRFNGFDRLGCALHRVVLVPCMNSCPIAATIVNLLKALPPPFSFRVVFLKRAGFVVLLIIPAYSIT